MKILPSLIDFGAFYPKTAGGAGSGRTSILTSQRLVFIEKMLLPMFAGSHSDKNLKDTVHAWEILNEPI